MKTMVVTLTVKTEIEYDPLDLASYEEKLEELVNELEDIGLSVSVETEVDSEGDEDEDGDGFLDDEED
jgi:hypothetical protein